MEHDIRKEARVWQRVQNEKQEREVQQRSDHLPTLIMEQAQLSAAYLQLARHLSGQDGALFMRLAREAKAQAVCLKGILSLMTGRAPETATTPPQFTTVDAMLRRCYGKELWLLKAYESRCSDPEYGPVYERMTQRGREHCCTVLELVGRMGKGK
ncbi:MAG: hypothetical protein IKT52_09935 [Oscillospiraceae bacterium]|nr:hypothetical protein [Oscillospiraceae bacterium]